MRIKELREKACMPQKELAIRMGLSQPTISAWEIGAKAPSRENLEKLADIFHVSIDYLLGRIDDPSSAHAHIGENYGLFLARLHEARNQARASGDRDLEWEIDELIDAASKNLTFPIGKLCQLAEISGVTVDYLLGRSDDPDQSGEAPVASGAANDFSPGVRGIARGLQELEAQDPKSFQLFKNLLDSMKKVGVEARDGKDP